MSDYSSIWLNIEREGLIRDLRGHLTSLRLSIDQALAALDSSGRVNASGLQHATAIAEMIGRWNVLREAAPRMESEK